MENSTKIGEYLTLADCTKSNSAKASNIDNTPSDEQIESMVLVAENIYDKVKEKFPKAFVSSFFRSVDLNKKIGGSKTSQHCKGEAIDIDSQSQSPRKYLGLFFILVLLFLSLCLL